MTTSILSSYLKLRKMMPVKLFLLMNLFAFVSKSAPIGELPERMRKWSRYGGDHGHSDLFEKLDRNEDGQLNFKTELQFYGVTKSWLDYYDKDKNGMLNQVEFMYFFRDRKHYVKADFDLPIPKGHLQPLGNHKPPRKDGIKEIFYTDENPVPITPTEFWQEHVEKHKPLLMRGVDRKSIAYEKWDEPYLLEKFGYVDLKLEPAAEDRGNKEAYTDLETHQYVPQQKTHSRLNITTFLEVGKGRNMYAVSILPQEMSWEVNFPAPALCGSRNVQVDRSKVSHNVAKLREYEDGHTKKKPAKLEPRKTLRKHPFPEPRNHTWLTHIFEVL